VRSEPSTSEAFYATQSAFTEPGEMAWLLDGLPRDIDALQRIANGLVIHFRIQDPAAVGLSRERIAQEIDSRYADTMLERLIAHDDRRLSERRAPGDRIAGCCRDFTVLFLTMARAQGLPARARAGFASYFFEGLHTDHEIAEVFDPDERRWRLVDGQLRAGHVDPNDGAELDPADLPRERFFTAGAAWRQCRAGQADPAKFMVRPEIELEMTRGLPYIAHNLVLDIAALNGREMLLWDAWGLAGKAFLWAGVSEQEIALLDRVAEATDRDELDLAELEALYSGEPLLRVPESFTSINPLALTPREVALR
jgi:hypothetical protein